MENTRKIQFRPRARIIRTIGDQLISGPEAAVIELVKNAYDADASYVIVRFVPPLIAGRGSIEVVDDGHGMTVEDIELKWMEPATSSKLGKRSSPQKGRQMLGSKGIGRFAAAKLGKKMSLLTVSDRVSPRTATLISKIDWSLFSEDVYLSDISIDYSTAPTTEPTGTTIEILELNEMWTYDKLERLYVELRRLISPLQRNEEENKSFRIFLDLSACTRELCGFDGRALVGAQGSIASPVPGSTLPLEFEVLPLPVMSACDYAVDGWFDDDGTFHGTMEIRSANQAPRALELTVPLGEEEASCGRVDVQLFIFDRDGAMIQRSMKRAGLGALSIGKAREFLDEVAGVGIYRDAFRVRPYGDRHADWLALDTRRVQDPSLRIGHNQIVGIIGVESQADSHLVERSSREGFEENGAFRRLRSLITELLAKRVEPRRQDFREKAGLSRRKDTSFQDLRKLSEFKQLRQILSGLPAEARAEAEAALAEQTTALDMRISQIEDRQRALEAKSSLGLIVGEILHEGAPAANFLASSAARLKQGWPMVLTKGPRSDEIRADFPERLELMVDSGDRLRDLFLMLQPLAGGARKSPQSFNVVNVVQNARKIFERHDATLNIAYTKEAIYLYGHPEDLSAALINLLANAVYWLEETRNPEPRVEIAITSSSADCTITVTDNGPGIDEEYSEKIFDVTFTTKDGGTGLGLNIAREALARSHATLDFDREYQGGARFTVTFPRYLGG